jgi:hypothetical protein
VVTRAEFEAQRYAHERLQGRVPVPEAFGWVEDYAEGARQGFMYMALANAPTLAAPWNGLTELDRQALCSELTRMVHA